MADSRAQRRRHNLYPLVGLVVCVIALLLLFGWVRNIFDRQVPRVIPPAEQCVAQVSGISASLGLEQSGNAAIIVAESMRRGLPARAATIALATAMQESSLRNLDHGDRDSVGLFQQRPSQGWGTVDEIMDPWYSSGKFYEHLVKVPNWQTGDINDVAQLVQRSGVPDGYRKHVDNARVWGSALTGHSAAALSCVNRGTNPPATADAVDLVKQAVGGTAQISVAQARVTITSTNPTMLWAATQLFMATSGVTGVQGVDVGGQTWTADPNRVASWQGSAAAKPAEATITLRA